MVKSFDLNDFNLSMFFSEVMLGLDIMSREGPEALNGIDYSKICCASEMLREKSREFKTGKYKGDYLSFFWLLTRRENETEFDPKYSRESTANKLLILSDELAIARDLPKHKLEELAKMCLKISNETAHYWDRKTKIESGKY